MIPAAWRWDHNGHYHDWVVLNLPPRPGSALDVGCGAGSLARRLAEHCAAVDAVDRAPHMIARAVAATSGMRPARESVHWVVGDILDPALPLRRPAYDVVTAVASLHHLPLRPGLTRLAELVAPGGTLLVVGLHRLATAGDFAAAPASLVADAAVGATRALRRRSGRPRPSRRRAPAPSPADAGAHRDGDTPLRDPVTSLAEIRAAAAEICPGAAVRRRLYWRFTLLWRRPTPAEDVPPGRVQ